MDEDYFAQSLSADFSTKTIDSKIMERAASRTVKQDYGILADAVGLPTMGAVDLADSVYTSTLGHVFGQERGTINDAVLGAIDSKGLTEYYNQRRGGIEAVSAIGGIIANELALNKVGKIPGVKNFVRNLKTSRFGKNIIALDTDYAKSLARVRQIDRAQIKHTAGLGQDLYSGAMSRASGFRVGGKDFATRSAAVSAARLKGAQYGVQRAAVSELSLAATMNQNEFLFTSSVATNMMYGGIGLGAVAGATNIWTNYAMRKFANSDVTRKLIAGALDPTGLRSKFHSVAAGVAAIGFKSDLESGFAPSFASQHFDEATTLLTQGKIAGGTAVDSTIANSTDIAKRQQAQLSMFTGAKDGLPGVPNSGFSNNTEGAANHLMHWVARDPLALTGLERLGVVPKGMSIDSAVSVAGGAAEKAADEIASRMWSNMQTIANFEERLKRSRAGSKAADKYKSRIEQLRKETDAMQPLLNFHKEMKKNEPMVIISGQVMTPTQAKLFDGVGDIKAKTLTEDGDFSAWAEKGDGTRLGVEVDKDGRIYAKTKGNKRLKKKLTAKDLHSFEPEKLFGLVKASNALLTHVQATAGKLTLDAKANWLEIDTGLELIRRTNNEGSVVLPAGSTLEKMELESFAQKVELIRALDDEAGGLAVEEIMQLKTLLNLPRITTAEYGLTQLGESAMDTLLRGKGLTGDQIRQSTKGELLHELNTFSDHLGLPAVAGAERNRLHGDLFDLMGERTTAGGNALRDTTPLIGMFRPRTPDTFTESALLDRVAMSQTLRAKTLLTAESQPVARITSALLSSPDFLRAAEVDSLSDLQAQSALIGTNSAPGQGIRKFTDSVISREMRHRDIPALQAVAKIAEQTDAMAQANMKEVFESSFHADLLNRYNGPANEPSRALVNHFYSHAGGWVLNGKTTLVQVPDAAGKLQSYTRFHLADIAENRDRWAKQFPDKGWQGDSTLLIDSRGAPVQVDELGTEIVYSMEKVSDQVLAADNALKRAAGLAESARRPFYVPPPDPTGKFVGYAIDVRGNIVPQSTIVARTQKEFDSLRKKMETDPDGPLGREGVVFRTREEAIAYADMYDRARLDQFNPSWTPLVGRASATGEAHSPFTDMGAFEMAIDTFRSKLLRQGRDVRELLLDPQIKAVKAQAAINRGQSPSMGQVQELASEASLGKSVHDMWLESALGLSPVGTNASWMTRVNSLAEVAYNTVAGAAAAQVNRVTNNSVMAAAQDYLANSNFFALRNTEKEAFKKMTQQLGKATPFKDALDYAEARGLGKAPPDMKVHMPHLQSWTATWMLRMAESTQAIMNMAGVVNAMPAVMRHVRRLDGESDSAFLARTGFSTTSWHDKAGGGSVTTLDMGKLALAGFKRAWNRKSDVDYQRLAGKGMLTQSSAELQQAFNATELRGGMDLFLNGDPRSSSKFKQRGVVGWLSFLTDESEHLSRSWGSFTGLELARLQGLTGDAADNFAHDFANKIIANYNPHNRAEVFQGTLGAPVGLFMSFVVAYYQRMFRYLETKDASAAATQYAWQSGIFGMQTVPGYAELEQFLVNTDSERLPYDAMVERFGQETGDLLMNGAMGNLPKLFGGPAMDFTSRGGVEVRLPVLSQKPAIYQMAEKVGTGVVQGLKAAADGDAMGTRLAEIASNAIPNRPMSALIEQVYLDGEDVDTAGRIATTTKGWGETAIRLMGAKSARQAAELDVFYMDQRVNEVQAAKQEKLRLKTRSMIRDGAEPNELQDVFDTYVENGGDPKNYRRWLKEQFSAAEDPRARRRLERLLRSDNPADVAKAQRFLNAQVSVSTEEETPDRGGLPEPTEEDFLGW